VRLANGGRFICSGKHPMECGVELFSVAVTRYGALNN